MIEVSNVSKNYGSLRAVDTVCFQVQRGECFGLLGPNGAGKSTTFGMLSGLIKPDQGTIRLDGASPALTATRRLLGIAPQSLSLYDELTARENLSFFGRLYGLSGKVLADRVAWGLDLAGLADRANGRVATFSGGMKRRLNIAVALIHQPEILLLDEPTVGVDPQSRNHIFQWLEQLKRDGMTLIYSTHYMEEAQRLCDRVAIIDSGKILALDTVPELLRRHAGASVINGSILKLPAEVTLPGQLSAANWRLECEQPFETLAELAAAGVEFQSLQVTNADLESVFLSLTGNRLRD